MFPGIFSIFLSTHQIRDDKQKKEEIQFHSRCKHMVSCNDAGVSLWILNLPNWDFPVCMAFFKTARSVYQCKLWFAWDLAIPLASHRIFSRRRNRKQSREGQDLHCCLERDPISFSRAGVGELFFFILNIITEFGMTKNDGKCAFFL